MFTGIVEEIGRVDALERHDGHARLHVGCRQVLGGVEVGDSIAVSGCCVTVTELTADGADAGFVADLMAETLAATSLGDLEVGSRINLERALRADDRLGGHLVQGHVDGVGEVVEREEQPGTVWLTITAPPSVATYLVAKGSVTVDGASLTVVDVHDAQDTRPATFRIALIPHTLEVTTFGRLRPGDRVNLEADVIAKYVERLLAAGTQTPYTALQES
jgi:riboflavin synthase